MPDHAAGPHADARGIVSLTARAEPRDRMRIDVYTGTGFLLERTVSQEFIEFDLVFRTGLEIAAPPPVVWSQLERLCEWKSSVASVERTAGVPDEVGEVLRIGQRRDDNIVYVIQRAVLVEANVHRVRTLTTEQGRGVDGYVIYSLAAQGSKTLLDFEMLAKGKVSADELQGRTPAQFAAMVTDATRNKVDSDHRVLKGLIERGISG